MDFFHKTAKNKCHFATVILIVNNQYKAGDSKEHEKALSQIFWTLKAIAYLNALSCLFFFFLECVIRSHLIFNFFLNVKTNALHLDKGVDIYEQNDYVLLRAMKGQWHHP